MPQLHLYCLNYIPCTATQAQPRSRRDGEALESGDCTRPQTVSGRPAHTHSFRNFDGRSAALNDVRRSTLAGPLNEGTSHAAENDPRAPPVSIMVGNV